MIITLTYGPTANSLMVKQIIGEKIREKMVGVGAPQAKVQMEGVGAPQAKVQMEGFWVGDGFIK